MNIHDVNFWQTIQNIQSTLQLSDGSTAELFQLTDKQFMALREKIKSPSIGEVTHFVTQLGIGFDSLFLQDVDYKVLAQRFGGDSEHAVPEKYLLNANSRRRTVLGILDFVESELGYAKRSRILRNLQLSEKVFIKLDDPIHLNLTLDIADYLFNYSRSEALIYKMGTYSILKYRNTAVTASLEESSCEIESYERMFCDIAPRFLEKNYRWEIAQARNQRIILNGHPNDFLRSEIRAHPEKHRLGCIIRSGFIGGMAGYTGKRAVRVMKSHCVANADTHCSYHIQI